ncbi:MAG: cytochrome P450 [Bifidobacteriaceae bacterium]|nr:cytochrome P450 [Bifidobacteriaceae bacterium]
MGTSFAAPFVVGIASLIRSDRLVADGDWLVRVRGTLYATAQASPPGQSGLLVDGYRAVSDASFEAATHYTRAFGTVSTPTRLGPITPQHGNRMLQVSAGPDDEQTAASVSIEMSAPADALTNGILTICFDYNYVTEEYPEYVNSVFNDFFRIDAILPSGARRNLVSESVNTTLWTPVTGISFPGGDFTVGQSGWDHRAQYNHSNQCWTLSAADLTPPGSAGGGPGPRTALRIVVSDVGDAIYHSVGLVDNIRVY